MPSKKKQHDYVPVHQDAERSNSKEYAIRGTLSEYPVSKWKKDKFKYGLHFSKHVQGLFMHPRPTIRRILKEQVHSKDFLVPLAVVIIAGILTAIGGSMWHILITTSVIIGFISAVKMLVLVCAMPVWFIFLWLFWTGLLHVTASVIAGRDVLNTHALHKTLKLVGFAFVPLFLNILPLLSLITGYWMWIVCAWGLELHYGIKKKRAFIATLPLLFATIIGTFFRLGLL